MADTGSMVPSAHAHSSPQSNYIMPEMCGMHAIDSQFQNIYVYMYVAALSTCFYHSTRCNNVYKVHFEFSQNADVQTGRQTDTPTDRHIQTEGRHV